MFSRSRHVGAAVVDDDCADDGALLARIGTGDVTALALLYDRHGAAVYGLATRLLANTDAAEAAVEEAFLEVWRRPVADARGRGMIGSRLLSIVWWRARSQRHDALSGWSQERPVD